MKNNKISLGLILLLVVVVMFFVFSSGKKINEEINKPITSNSIVSDSVTNKSISSENLGIKVEYYSNNKNEIFAKEEGDIIYFWNNYNVDYKDGQSLEIFSKDEQTSFDKAISDKFLNQEKYRDNCYVSIIEDTVEYRKVIIDFKKPLEFPENTKCISGDPSPSCDSCPNHYSKTNASQYFIYYKKHSDKFFYLNLGQESLVGGYDYYWNGNGDPREWFNNIKFIK